MAGAPSDESALGFPTDWDSDAEPSGMFAANEHLLLSLRKIVETELGHKLHPSDTPQAVRDFKAPSGAAKGGIHYRAGDGKDVWMLMQARLTATPPGMFLVTCSVFLGPATDAPHLILEVSTTPKLIFLSLECLPRRDMIEHIEYLDEVYIKSGLAAVRARVDKDERFTPYVSPDPYTRMVLSPTHILKNHKLAEDAGVDRPVLKAMKEVVQPLAEEVLGIWLKVVKERANNIPEGPARAALKRRDHWLRLNSILRDPGTSMGKMVLGPELGELVVRSMTGGPDRFLSPEEHSQLKPSRTGWQGTHTKYSPEWEVKETVEFNRGNDKIDQGTGEVKEYNLPGGHGAAACPNLQSGKGLLVKLRVMSSAEDRTAAVAIQYSPDGQRTGIELVREGPPSADSSSATTWSSADKAASDRPTPNPKLEGIETTLSSELFLAERWGDWQGFAWPGPPGTGSRVGGDDYKLLHLPDGLSVYVPKLVNTGKGFGLSLHWLEKDDVMHQMSVWYNREGRFESAKAGTYSKGFDKY